MRLAAMFMWRSHRRARNAVAASTRGQDTACGDRMTTGNGAAFGVDHSGAFLGRRRAPVASSLALRWRKPRTDDAAQDHWNITALWLRPAPYGSLVMKPQWILAANASLARLFSRDSPTDHLVPLATMEHPESRLKRRGRQALATRAQQ